MLKFLQNIIAILTVKSSAFLIKLFKLGSGTNLPGRIARKISPGILSCLVNQTKKEIITITGTNGKTTTAGLISSVFRAQGRKITHNRKGANMLNGITSTVAENSSAGGKLDCDNSILELDEAYLNPAFDEFNPDIVLVTNLFRDQLDRYGELNTTAKKIESAVEKSARIKPLKLVLNSDDPLVSGIADGFGEDGLTKIFFGFDRITHLNEQKSFFSPQETINCKCGKPFSYTKIFYGHLGHYECSCATKRHTPQVRAEAVAGIDHSIIKIKHGSCGQFEFRVNLPGLYNCYNALSAAAAALEAGILPENIKNGIEKYSTTFGRAESVTLKGKEVLIQLIKNPIGATEVLRTIKNDKNGKLLIIINDNYADGRDVSWLWDANFELLAGYNKTAVISGLRAADMAVRLKYAGIKSQNLIVEQSIKEGLLQALEGVNNSEKLYILPTYTALLELEKLKQTL